VKTAVIMPTLAKPGWDRNLRSLLQQTAPADELIVVVDRSVSPEERQALEAGEPAIRFLFNPRNIGITASLNRALAATDADIVFRADDDDESLPTRFARQLACFAETGADFVASWAEGVSGGDLARAYQIRCPTDDADIKAALVGRNVLVHPTLAFRRERILALGGYDETFVNAQDYGLYLAGLRAGYRFAAVPEPLVRRHYADDNISVKRRYNQLMYSCAARVVHHAATGDRRAFLATLASYARLAATPMWARTARRRLFKLVGRGA
jgi:glycosyltransferase involved in cell wall biosynthesis